MLFTTQFITRITWYLLAVTLVCLGPVWLTPAKAATTVTFQEGTDGYSGTEDTWIDGSNQTTAYGSASELDIDGDNPESSGLLRWDLSSIPSDATVDSVSLELTNFNAGDDYEIYEALKPWTESATWKTYDGSASWGSAGAAAVGTDRSSTALGVAPQSVGTAAVDLGEDGVALVQDWISGASTNNGFVIQDYGVTNGIGLRSSEYTTTSERPKITIGYSTSTASTGSSVVSGTVYSDQGSTTVGSGEVVQVAALGSGDGTLDQQSIDTLPGQRTGVAEWNADETHMALFSVYNSPYIHLYARDGAGLTKLANPPDLPNKGMGATWVGDTLIVVHQGSTHQVSYYELTGDTLALTATSTLPGDGIDIARNGDFFAVTYDGGNLLSLYELVDGELVHRDNPTNNLSEPSGLAWDDDYLVVGNSGGQPNLTLYSLDGASLTLENEYTDGGFVVNDLDWNDGYLATGHFAGSEETVGLRLWRRDGNTLTMLINDGLVVGRGDTVEWRGDYLAAGAADLLYLFRLDGDDLVEQIVPVDMGGKVRGVTWDDNSNLSVTHDTGDELTYYQFSPDVVRATTTTNSSGTWEASLTTTVTDTTPITVWASSTSFAATTILQGADATSVRSSIPLYADTLQAHGTTTTVDLTDFSFYDSKDNSNILFTATSTGTTAFTAEDTLLVPSGVAAQLPDTLTLKGGFSKRGTVLGADTAVTLAGSDQILNANSTTTFSSLTKTVGSADTLWFSSGSAWDVTDSLDLTGAAENLLSLRSTTSPGAASKPTWEAVSQNFYFFKTSGTFDKPAGTEADDILIAVAFGQTGTINYTWPTGWTQVGEAYTGFADLGMQVYWAPGDVSDTTLTADSSKRIWLTVHRFSGADTASPIRNSSVTAGSGASADRPTGSVTAAAGDAVLATWTAYQSDGAWGAVESGYTSRLNDTQIVDSPDTSDYSWRWAAATREDVAAGATGPISHNQNNTYEARSEAAIAIAGSTASAGAWYIDAPTDTTASYLDVEYSHNVASTAVSCGSCTDSGNNTNWSFDTLDTVTLEHATTSFHVGQMDPALPTLTIDQGSEPSITTATDIRIKLPTDTMPDLQFDDTVTSVTLGGTASGKVSASVSYEATNTVAVITVSSDFVADDVVTVDGLEVTGLTTVGHSGNLSLYLDSDTTGEAVATANSDIGVTGSITQSDHADGQADNQFSFQNTDDASVFAFSLIVSDEDMDITSTEFLLDGYAAALSNIRLYQDNDSDGVMDGGDTLVASGGTLSGSTLTFSDTFTATTSQDHILVADVSNVSLGTTLEISLSDMDVTGVTSERTVTLLGAVDPVEHERAGSGGGGGSTRVSTQGQLGDDVATSTVTVTGGGSDGGDSLDPDSGDSLVLGTGYYAPSSTGGAVDQWSSAANAYTSNGSYATADGDGLAQSYGDFGISIPGGNEVTGVTVKFEANSTAATGTLSVALSWDGGSTFTTARTSATLADTDTVYSVGGESDEWGRSWSDTEFSDANFVLRVTSDQTGATVHQLDTIHVRPHHQTTGGSGGGGGALGFWFSEWLSQLQTVWQGVTPAQVMANLIFSLP